ncbi:MAG: hypothetical protein LC623_05395 [Halobacteriales archaeon]|nr:hypothetical protein [Halobacteriales archaeon]
MTNVTAHVRAAIRERFPPPDWLVAFEVQFPRDEGGYRFADAVAFDTRKGAGMAVHGFEVKVSRADWLTEVRNPRKADPGRASCDYWWVVEGKPGIVKPEELPHGVGLYSLGGGGEALLLARIHASVRDPRPGERPLERSLVAAFLRRQDPLEPRAYFAAREREAEQRGFNRGRNEAGRLARKRDRLERAGISDGVELNLP